MIPELGHVALIIAFVLAIGLAVVPMWGAARRDVAAMNMALSLAVGVTVFVNVKKSGLYFQPPITIINSKKIIVLIIKPTGICFELSSDANHWFFAELHLTS